MSDYEGMKLVDFDKYCLHCKYREQETWEYPCDECIPNAARQGTCVPVNYNGPKLVTPEPSMKEKLGLK